MLHQTQPSATSDTPMIFPDRWSHNTGMRTAGANMMAQDGRVSEERYHHAEIISIRNHTLSCTA